MCRHFEWVNQLMARLVHHRALCSIRWDGRWLWWLIEDALIAIVEKILKSGSPRWMKRLNTGAKVVGLYSSSVDWNASKGDAADSRSALFAQFPSFNAAPPRMFGHGVIISVIRAVCIFIVTLILLTEAAIGPGLMSRLASKSVTRTSLQSHPPLKRKVFVFGYFARPGDVAAWPAVSSTVWERGWMWSANEQLGLSVASSVVQHFIFVQLNTDNDSFFGSDDWKTLIC